MPWLRCITVFLLVAASVRAGDWPQWLGPNRDASTEEKVDAWKGELKVLWRQEIGEGNSSPVVADGSVYLHYKLRDAYVEQLEAFDAASGKRLWKSKYERPKATFLFGNGPRATPTVVGGKIYTHGINGMLACFDAQNGKELWRLNTWKKFNAPKLFFGSSCSPLIEGDKVLLNVGGKGSSIVAFDKNSGKLLWKTLDHRASYASPIAIGRGIERQAIFLTGQAVVSVAPKDGSVFWQVPFKDALGESSSTPVKSGDLLVASSITKGSVGLRLDDTGQIPKTEQVWINPKLNCYFSTPVPVGSQLYMVTGTKPKKPLSLFGKAVLRCIETESGKELWTGPKVGTFHASLIRTGNDKLLLLEEKGNLVLLDPNPKGYRELARSKICGSTWSHAAISNGRLYIRDAKELLCIELPK